LKAGRKRASNKDHRRGPLKLFKGGVLETRRIGEARGLGRLPPLERIKKRSNHTKHPVRKAHAGCLLPKVIRLLRRGCGRKGAGETRRLGEKGKRRGDQGGAIKFATSGRWLVEKRELGGEGRGCRRHGRRKSWGGERREE